eukprot:30816-Pelagococcus_subviridis.AAC.5
MKKEERVDGGVDLDRVAERRPRAVHLQQARSPDAFLRHGAGTGTGTGTETESGFSNDRALGRTVRRGQRAAPSVLVHRRPRERDDGVALYSIFVFFSLVRVAARDEDARARFPAPVPVRARVQCLRAIEKRVHRSVERGRVQMLKPGDG